MDRGAWWATVQGAEKSQTWLSMHPQWVFITAHGIFSWDIWTLSSGMWDLVPWPGIELGSLHQQGSPWTNCTNREVPIFVIKTFLTGTSLLVQWLGVHASTARSMGSIFGQVIKILQAAQQPKKKTKTKTIFLTEKYFFKKSLKKACSRYFLTSDFLKPWTQVKSKNRTKVIIKNLSTGTRVSETARGNWLNLLAWNLNWLNICCCCGFKKIFTTEKWRVVLCGGKF